MSYERKRWHTHVFTSTYTADVSGVCSAMFELGGMTILHDPSGCNSTYTTHDEPRWYDSKSLMFVSGLDEMTAVMGDDSVLIKDAVRAAADLKPRFITLCGASIPHIISFDFKGVARLIERETGIPVLPVATDGLRSYVSGAGLAFREWIRRFADTAEIPAGTGAAAMVPGNPPRSSPTDPDGNSPRDLTGISPTDLPGSSSTDLTRAERLLKYGVNLLGVTPIDFSRQEIVDTMKRSFTDAGIPVNTCFAMGDSFENLTHVYRGAVNVVVSSAGRIPARFMKGTAGIPFVEGLPMGSLMTDRLLEAVRQTAADGKDRRIFEPEPGPDSGAVLAAADGRTAPAASQAARALVIGEEIQARTLAAALNAMPVFGDALNAMPVSGDTLDAMPVSGDTLDAISAPAAAPGILHAEALWPDTDEGLDEDILMEKVNASRIVIGDPLFRTVLRNPETRLVEFPHEGYSGRIFRDRIPVFTGPEFDPKNLGHK